MIDGMKVEIEGKEYILETKANHSVIGEDIINKGVEYARNVLKITPLCEQLENLTFKGIYLYDEKEINAFSVKKDEGYIIAFSYGFFVKTYNWLMLWKQSPQIDEIFHLGDEYTKEVFFNNAYVNIVVFVTAHELYHILNGHCDLPENKNRLMTEQNKNVIFEQNLFDQILEYDADYCASQLCAGITFSLKVNYDSILLFLRAQVFGLYNIFLLFNDSGMDDIFEFRMKSNFAVNGHPQAGIRAVYCIASITEMAMRFWDIETTKRAFMIIQGECIAYDRILLNHNKLKECLYTIAFTEKGAQHIMFLNNEWKSVREKLLNYAYIDLRECEKLESFPVWITDDGDVRLKD